MLENINYKNYNIQIFNNLLTLSERYKIYDFIKNSRFQIGWNDTAELENNNFSNLYSFYNEEDLNKLNFVNFITKNNLKMQHLFNTHHITKSIVNLTKPTDVYFSHYHPEDKVLLYYVNVRWKEEWGGETLFFDDNLQDIFFTSSFSPGRIIVFDGMTPHTIRPQSIAGPHYRFTLSIFLSKKDE
jgi:Rps23 Pro-64 3,4-dihydroxylase Tpa1-like proline 4-hydroxylase